MNHIFLSLLKDARKQIKSDPVELDFIKLYRLSREHQVSPLIYNQIYFFSGFPENLKIHWKKEAIQENVFQTIKTERFLKLYQQFLDHDLKIIVVKGIVLRSLYPQPENRPSNDEDLYIEKKDLEKAKDIFLKEKFVLTGESDDVTTFVDYQSGLSIELHSSLFSKDSKAYGKYQDAFEHAFEHMIVHDIQGVPIYSLSYDLHLLFLMMHFVKHFLHGGVGIRQIIDIVMYSETYGDTIHWNRIYHTLEQLDVLVLIENVLALAHQHLGFDFSKIKLPDDYDEKKCDYDDLLDDILDAGIFGKSSEERLHSSTMTLNALEKGKSSVLKSIFPTFKEMKGKYSYLKHYPFLLPVAYVSRIIRYLKHNDTKKGQKTIEIGNQRIQLLKKYQVMK